MDASTITLVIGIIGCVIGVSTFVSSLQNKAQNTGVLEQKIEQALQGIDEIKRQVKDSSANQNSMSLTVQSHTEQIKNLFKSVDELKTRLRTVENTDKKLGEILDAIKSLKEEQT